MRELRTGFHQTLTSIDVKVAQLFAYITEDMVVATEALLGGDAEALEVLRERERLADSIYQEIEEVVNRQLALQSPVARDLRLLLCVLRVVPELERSHDLVVHIAEHATHILSHELSPRARGLVQRMGDVGGDMWRRAADAWQERDGTAATVMDELDDGMDSLHAALTAELASGSLTLPVAMDMTLVARFYERLGDHAVNITRRVVYLAG